MDLNSSNKQDKSDSRKYTLRDLQLTQLEILLNVRDFCDSHHIRYYIYCGTLLGCIRHKGFIPWDDDIDIAIPLQDYKRFVKEYPSSGDSDYFLRTVDIDSTFYQPWARVFKRNTLYYSRLYEDTDIYREVGFDIYPIIGAYRNDLLAKIQTKLIRLAFPLIAGSAANRSRTANGDKHPRMRRIVNSIPRGIRIGIFKLFRAVTWCDPGSKPKNGTVDAAIFYGKFDRTDWDEPLFYPFEGELFAIPHEYDKMLRIMYGDYMTPPPEGARSGHLKGDIVLDLPGSS